MNPNKVTLLYDNDTEMRRGPGGAQAIHFIDDPAWLVGALALFGGQADMTVLVSEHDPQGKRFLKYGAEVVPVNGNRKQVLAQRLPDLLESLRRTPPWLLMVISRDPALAGLLESAAAYCVVMVFSPGEDIPAAYSEAAERARRHGLRLDTRRLADLPLQPRRPRVRLFVDGENLLGSYRDAKARPDPQETRQALRSIAACYGQLCQETYLADWYSMPGGAMFRAELEGSRVDIIQVDSRRGKGSTDHVLVAEVMEKLSETDRLVVFTNDTDLRHLFRKARSQGVWVVSVGTHANHTRDLGEAADEVVYLDDLLPALRAPGEKTAEDLLTEIADWAQVNDWRWIYKDRLFNHFGANPRDRQLLEEIIVAGYLMPGKKNPETTLQFNPAMV